VRLLGGGMLIFAALALGFMARRRAADHLHALERALTLVRHAKREIELFGTPCGMLFAHYGETVDEAWMNRLYAELDSDSASIRDFFARLGGGYREDTLRLCDSTIAALEEKRRQAEREYPARSKLCAAMPLLFAVSVIVLIL